MQSKHFVLVVTAVVVVVTTFATATPAGACGVGVSMSFYMEIPQTHEGQVEAGCHAFVYVWEPPDLPTTMEVPLKRYGESGVGVSCPLQEGSSLHKFFEIANEVLEARKARAEVDGDSTGYPPE